METHGWDPVSLSMGRSSTVSQFEPHVRLRLRLRLPCAFAFALGSILTPFSLWILQGGPQEGAIYLPVLLTDMQTSVHGTDIKLETTSLVNPDGTPSKTLRSSVYYLMPRAGSNMRTPVTRAPARRPRAGAVVLD